MVSSSAGSIRPNWKLAFEAFISYYFRASHIKELTKFVELSFDLLRGIDHPLLSKTHEFSLTTNSEWGNSDMRVFFPHLKGSTKEWVRELSSLEGHPEPKIEINIQQRGDKIAITVKFEVQLFGFHE